MKILLLRPPTFSKTLTYPGGPRFGLPLGILYLAAVLEKNRFDVSVYDALIDCNLDALHKNESGYYHIGAAWIDLVKKALAFSPDIIGISNPFSDFADYALQCAREIKNADPRTCIVVGGPHASVKPESFLTKDNAVDYVIRGEGEQSFLELVRALERKEKPETLPGVTFFDHGKIRSNPLGNFIAHLDELPLPAYHLVPMDSYIDIVKKGFPSRFSFEYAGSEREASIVTSRGCPFHCVFCGNHLHMGRAWRYHSADNVLLHMEHLITKFAIRHFHIEDDNLSLNPVRFEAILDGIIERKWNITWDTPNGVRAEGLTEPLLKKIKQSGCTYLIIGIESGNQRVLDTIIKKHLKLEDAKKTLAACKNIGLDAHGFYIVGFPGETRQEIHDTFHFALAMLWKYGCIPHLGLARPLPGTELYETSKKNNLLTAPLCPEIGSSLRGEIFQREMIRTKDFSPTDLENWVAQFNSRMIRLLLTTLFFWIICNPKALINIILKFFSALPRGFAFATKKVLFGGLFFKFNFLKKFKKIA